MEKGAIVVRIRLMLLWRLLLLVAELRVLLGLRRQRAAGVELRGLLGVLGMHILHLLVLELLVAVEIRVRVLRMG